MALYNSCELTRAPRRELILCSGIYLAAQSRTSTYPEQRSQLLHPSPVQTLSGRQPNERQGQLLSSNLYLHRKPPVIPAMTSVSSLFSLQLRYEESHLADRAGNLVVKSKGFSRRKMDCICKGALWNYKDNDETLHLVAIPILGMVTTIRRMLWSSVSKHKLSIASHCSLTTIQ